MLCQTSFTLKSVGSAMHRSTNVYAKFEDSGLNRAGSKEC